MTGANRAVLRENEGGLLGDLVMPESSPKVNEVSPEMREALQAAAMCTGSGGRKDLGAIINTRRKTRVGVPRQGGPCLGVRLPSLGDLELWKDFKLE